MLKAAGMYPKRQLSAKFLTLQLLSMTLICSGMYGQLFTGSITGVVTDPNQATVAGAEVSVENAATSDNRKATTAADGRFTITQLVPGDYLITISAAGFKTYKRTGISIHTSQALELNAELTLGA